MQWLVTQMWIALAVASFIGLLMGMALRGLTTANRIRRAQVERDIAMTELDQSRSEVDALYAAQRKRQDDGAQAVSGNDGLVEELAQREAKITGLGEELAAARAELDQLRAGGAAAGAAALAPAAALVGAATQADTGELTALKERNTWLEDRVAALETEVSNAAAATAEAAPAIPAKPDEELARLRWRNRYLESRLAYYEGEEGAEGEDDDTDDAGAVMADAPDDDEADLVEETTEEIEPETENVLDIELDEPPVDEPVGAAEAEPEMASAEEASEDSGLADILAANVVDAAPAEPEPVEEPVMEAAPEPEPAPEPQPEAPAPEEDSDPLGLNAAMASAGDEHPADAMLKQLDAEDVPRERPEGIDIPANGGDDLTAISGIGPRIAELLNELGIWTHAQIAAWRPEHTAWVEQHLSFKGRVGREEWIEQATALTTDGA